METSALASHAAPPKGARGWVSALKQLCDVLEGRLEEVRLGGVPEAVEHLATGWDELRALADTVQG